MHVGHTRGAVFGDALASLLAYVGYDVTREYYINDAGGQIDVLAQSALLRYREALGETIEIPPGLYPGDYLIPVGQTLAAEFGASLARKAGGGMAAHRQASGSLDDMMELDQAPTSPSSTSSTTCSSPSARCTGRAATSTSRCEWLRERGHWSIRASLEAPKGQVDEDWEEREQTLFRATDFGDDTDRALVKSDGSYTYFAADIAYHRNKYLRGFKHMVNVLGADHSGYVKRLQAAVKAVSDGDRRHRRQDHAAGAAAQERRAVQDEQADRRSGPAFRRRRGSRARRDALHAALSAQRRRRWISTSPWSRSRPATTRCSTSSTRTPGRARCSARRNRELPALSLRPPALAAAPIELLVSAADIELIKALAQWPRTVAAAALAHEPHRIAFYLYELAAAFHGFWAKGKDDRTLRFVNPEDLKLTMARLALVGAVRQVLVNGLTVLGVSAPEELS